MHDDSSPQRPPSLLCISPSFAPATTPTAIRASKLLARLSEQRSVTVLTASAGARGPRAERVEVIRARPPRRLIATLRRLRLHKLLEIFMWPDESIFWVLPAIRAGKRLISERRPEAIVVFMMPYSAGLVGVALSRLCALPLILNLDDSPTCSDMHPEFPTRLHYRLAMALEDFYARRADAIVYVSESNRASVRSRQDAGTQQKFHLVRYGAERVEPADAEPGGETFEIAYVGAMSGWWALIAEHSHPRALQRLYGAWTRLGWHRRVELDHRTSSPAVIGRAILDATAEHPQWSGRVRLSLHGNPYPPAVVQRALRGEGLEGVVTVHDPVPHEQVSDILRHADVLFLTLPARPDGSPGGRISAKTYEYLATDRPILAAVPHGENWDYLSDKQGVWLLEPDDRAGMQRAIGELVAAKFAGDARAFDRSALQRELSYDTRAGEFASVIDAAIDNFKRRRTAKR
jgi:Glycosyl transferase 4-like domain